MSDPFNSPKTTAVGVIDTMEGQALYELYVSKMLQYSQASPRLKAYANEYAPPDRWRQLSPLQKALWQEIAQEFLKAAS